MQNPRNIGGCITHPNQSSEAFGAIGAKNGDLQGPHLIISRCYNF